MGWLGGIWLQEGMWWDASALYGYKVVCDGMNPPVYGYKEVCDGMNPLYMVTRRYVMGFLSSIWLQDGMWWDVSGVYGYKEVCDGMPQLYMVIR